MSPEYGPVNFETKTVLVENRKVSYLEREGNGAPILMLPGYPWGKEMFLKLFSDLKNDSRLVALNYPGWEDCDPLDTQLNYEVLSIWVMKVADRLNISKVNLLGCSFGGAISLNMAYHYPNRINSVLVNAPPVFFKRHMDRKQNVLYQVGSRIPKGKEFAHRNLMEGKIWAWKAFFGKHFVFKDDPFSQSVFESGKKVQLESFFESMVQIINTDIHPILPQIKVPVLLITGDQDFMLKDSEEAHSKIDGSRLIKIKGGDHHAIVDHSEEFAELAYNFFKLSEMSK